MKFKAILTFGFLTLIYCCILAKAFYISILNKEKLTAYSKSQIVREVKIYPKRGYILDRDDNPLAINVVKYNIFTFGKNIKTFSRELKKLKKIMPEIHTGKILKLAKQRGKFTWIGRKISLNDQQVESIKKFETILVEPISSRYYPNNELFSQSLGFVGIDNDGLAGIEYYFNDKLKGDAEIFKYLRDAKGRPVKFKTRNFESRAQDISLSIDKNIQASLEQYLEEAVKTHEAEKAGAAVMDAVTGEIWAMANYPSFDPNDFDNNAPKRLSFITDPFEPGSVMKTITIASALENKVVKADTNFYCERGRYRIGKHTITESDNNHVYEWLSVSDILRFSSNIGTTKISFDLTYPKLRKTMNDFNFGRKTGVEISGESRGILTEEKKVKPIRLSNISFGQGVATTGIQMLSAYAVFANGGYYVKPTILKIKNKNKIKSKKILSSSTVKEINKMLIEAVEDGTGSNAIVPHFTVAGKTSTAQRPDEHGGYSGYISGFVGYPVDVDKRFVVFVYVENPQKEYYGNAVAAPVFKKIVKKILYKDKAYMKKARLSDAKNKAFDQVSTKSSGRLKIEKGFMPDLIGLDKITAKSILDKLDLNYEAKGFGILTKQFPKAGVEINRKTKIKLRFKAPKI